MKNKYIAWISASILGALAITFGVLFGISNNKEKQLQGIVDGINNSSHAVVIRIDASDDTKDAEYIYEVEGTKKLDELMLEHSDIFKLSANDPLYGRYIEGIEGITLPSNGFWSLESATYSIHNKNADTPNSDQLAVGVSSVIITNDEIFTLVEETF